MTFLRVGLWSTTALVVALGPTFPAHAADYAPINCAKASSPAEKAICSNYALGQSEARVATLFGVTTSLVAMGQRGEIQDDQRAFLSTRDACQASVSCPGNAYDARVQQLEQVVARIRERGPF